VWQIAQATRLGGEKAALVRGPARESGVKLVYEHDRTPAGGPPYTKSLQEIAWLIGLQAALELIKIAGL